MSDIASTPYVLSGEIVQARTPAAAAAPKSPGDVIIFSDQLDFGDDTALDLDAGCRTRSAGDCEPSVATEPMPPVAVAKAALIASLLLPPAQRGTQTAHHAATEPQPAHYAQKR